MAQELTTNFAVSTVATAPSPATTGTSLVVQAGHGARFDAAVDHNAIVCPADAQPTSANAEIVRITAISTDTFTITRQQESTSARTIVVGDRIFAGPTVKTFTDIYSDINTAQFTASAAVAGATVDAKGDMLAASADNTVVRVPAAGSNNMVLRSNSGATPGVDWTSNFNLDNGLPGLLVPQGMPQVGLSSTTLTASRAYFLRCRPQRDYTITTVAFLVSAFASADDQCSIGQFTVNGADLTHVASVGATSGKLNTAVGRKTFTGLSWTFTAGTVYWVGFSVGTFGGTGANLLMANGVANGAFDLFGTSPTLSTGLFKASAHPVTGNVTAPSSNAAQVPILALIE